MCKEPTGAILVGLTLLFMPALGGGQEPEESLPLTGYTAPTKDDWLKAGLDPVEYDLAVRYEATLEEWKKMDHSRRTSQMAGWACIGLGLLIPAVEATIIWGGGVDWTDHPEQEAFIMVTAAAVASILVGIVVAASAPGPEDFKRAWMWKAGQISFYPAPSPGGTAIGFSF